MTENEKKQAFVDGLRQQWQAQVDREGNEPSYSFNGWTGMEYNSWLEHRHGWPVTEEGWCGPSWASTLDPDEPNMEIDFTDCPTCLDIVAQYAAQGTR